MRLKWRSRENLFGAWFFLRILGLIYLVAFGSFWIQMEGLIGSRGILPARYFLESVGLQLGPERYWLVPTLAWISPSDIFLHFLCGGGVFLSLLLVADVAPALVSFLLWVFYLSVASVAREFMGFQWDSLLLEAGFLAIFLSPPSLKRGSSGRSTSLWVVILLFRWLLFRLVFSSGVVKLASGDAMWRSLTALTVHYETQPLPTWVGWYVHQLPIWFHKSSCGLMFAAELLVPFLFFAPRRWRLLGCTATVGFQALILLTGNYCFFNLLTIALCLFLVDDTAWRRLLPVLSRRGLPPPEGDSEPAGVPRSWPAWVVGPVAVVILLVTAVQMTALARGRISWPRPVWAVVEAAAPFRSVNTYGLFAIMTAQRPEIVVEGSDDGATWRAYEFKYKPGDLACRPGFIAPYQPRLDWQMWFAALGEYRENPWFVYFCVRLLEGSPPVLRLLKTNPFPNRPPRYLRAILYRYRFTDFQTRRVSGAWWRREKKGLYCPVLSLNADSKSGG